MRTLRLKGEVDQEHRLRAVVPSTVPPGPIEVQVEVPEATWEQAIAQEWAGDWNDPREDIYTIEDGEPVE